MILFKFMLNVAILTDFATPSKHYPYLPHVHIDVNFTNAKHGSSELLLSSFNWHLHQSFFRRVVAPIEPKHTIRYADEEGNPMDIVDAKFSNDTNSGYAVLIVAYGTLFNVAFDKLVSNLLSQSHLVHFFVPQKSA